MASQNSLRTGLLTATMLLSIFMGCKRENAANSNGTHPAARSDIQPSKPQVVEDERTHPTWWLDKAQKEVSRFPEGAEKTFDYCAIANIYSFLGKQDEARQVLLTASKIPPGLILAQVGDAQANLGFIPDALITAEKCSAVASDKNEILSRISGRQERAGHLIEARKTRSKFAGPATQSYDPGEPRPPFVVLLYPTALDDPGVLNARGYADTDIHLALMNVTGVPTPERQNAAYVAVAVAQAKKDKEGALQTFEIAKEKVLEMPNEFTRYHAYQLIVEGEIRAGSIDDAIQTIDRNIKGSSRTDFFAAVAKTYYLHASIDDASKLDDRLSDATFRAGFAMGMADALIMSKQPPTTQPHYDD